jgi:beta-lactamase superfamily II metal-dependent hydrolase
VVSENDNTVLLLVRFGTLQVWVGGDTSGDVNHRYYADVETAAVILGRIGSALDVYGVDHHGSCYSTNANLVSATLPTVSVFSLGLNSYGHPCPTVVDRLNAAASAMYFTELGDGTVIDGNVKIGYTGGSTYTVTGTLGATTFTTKTPVGP